MAITLETLRLEFEADFSKFDKSLDDASRKAEKFAKKVENKKGRGYFDLKNCEEYYKKLQKVDKLLEKIHNRGKDNGCLGLGSFNIPKAPKGGGGSSIGLTTLNNSIKDVANAVKDQTLVLNKAISRLEKTTAGLEIKGVSATLQENVNRSLAKTIQDVSSSPFKFLEGIDLGESISKAVSDTVRTNLDNISVQIGTELEIEEGVSRASVAMQQGINAALKQGTNLLKEELFGTLVTPDPIASVTSLGGKKATEAEKLISEGAQAQRTIEILKSEYNSLKKQALKTAETIDAFIQTKAFKKINDKAQKLTQLNQELSTQKDTDPSAEFKIKANEKKLEALEKTLPIQKYQELDTRLKDLLGQSEKITQQVNSFQKKTLETTARLSEVAFKDLVKTRDRLTPKLQNLQKTVGQEDLKFKQDLKRFTDIQEKAKTIVAKETNDLIVMLKKKEKTRLRKIEAENIQVTPENKERLAEIVKNLSDFQDAIEKEVERRKKVLLKTKHDLSLIQKAKENLIVDFSSLERSRTRELLKQTKTEIIQTNKEISRRRDAKTPPLSKDIGNLLGLDMTDIDKLPDFNLMKDVSQQIQGVNATGFYDAATGISLTAKAFRQLAKNIHTASLESIELIAHEMSHGIQTDFSTEKLNSIIAGQAKPKLLNDLATMTEKEARAIGRRLEAYVKGGQTANQILIETDAYLTGLRVKAKALAIKKTGQTENILRGTKQASEKIKLQLFETVQGLDNAQEAKESINKIFDNIDSLNKATANLDKFKQLSFSQGQIDPQKFISSFEKELQSLGKFRLTIAKQIKALKRGEKINFELPKQLSQPQKVNVLSTAINQLGEVSQKVSGAVQNLTKDIKKVQQTTTTVTQPVKPKEPEIKISQQELANRAYQDINEMVAQIKKALTPLKAVRKLPSAEKKFVSQKDAENLQEGLKRANVALSLTPSGDKEIDAKLVRLKAQLAKMLKARIRILKKEGIEFKEQTPTLKEIKGYQQQLRASGGDFTKGFTEAIKKDASVEKSTELLGEDAVKGFRQGIDARSPSIETLKAAIDFIKGFVNKIKSSLGNFSEATKEAGKKAVQGLNNGLSEEKEMLKTAANQLKKDLTFITDNKAFQKLGEMAAPLNKGMKKVVDKLTFWGMVIKDKVKGIFDKSFKPDPTIMSLRAEEYTAKLDSIVEGLDQQLEEADKKLNDKRALSFGDKTQQSVDPQKILESGEAAGAATRKSLDTFAMLTRSVLAQEFPLVQYFNDFRKGFEGVGSAALSAKSQVAGFATGIVLILFGRQIIQGIQNLIEFEKELETVQNRLRAVNALPVNNIFDEFEEDAKNAGIRVLEFSNSFARMKASLRGKVGNERSVFADLTEGLGNRGVTGESMSRALAGLEQVASKGVLQMEELRQQLSEALPGALLIAANAMGVTEKQLLKMVGNSQVLAGEFLPKLAEELTNTSISNDTLTKALIETQNTFDNIKFNVTNIIPFKEAVKGLNIALTGLEFISTPLFIFLGTTAVVALTNLTIAAFNLAKALGVVKIVSGVLWKTIVPLALAVGAVASTWQALDAIFLSSLDPLKNLNKELRSLRDGLEEVNAEAEFYKSSNPFLNIKGIRNLSKNRGLLREELAAREELFKGSEDLFDLEMEFRAKVTPESLQQVQENIEEQLKEAQILAEKIANKTSLELSPFDVSQMRDEMETLNQSIDEEIKKQFSPQRIQKAIGIIDEKLKQIDNEIAKGADKTQLKPLQVQLEFQKERFRKMLNEINQLTARASISLELNIKAEVLQETLADTLNTEKLQKELDLYKELGNQLTSTGAEEIKQRELALALRQKELELIKESDAAAKKVIGSLTEVQTTRLQKIVGTDDLTKATLEQVAEARKRLQDEQTSGTEDPLLEAALNRLEAIIQNAKRVQELEVEEVKSQVDSLKQLKNFKRSLEDFEFELQNSFKQRSRALMDNQKRIEDTNRQFERENRNLEKQYEDFSKSLNKQLKDASNQLLVLNEEIINQDLINEARVALGASGENLFEGFVNAAESILSSNLDTTNRQLSLEEQRIQAEENILSLTRQMEDMALNRADVERNRLNQLEQLSRSQEDFTSGQERTWLNLARKFEEMRQTADEMGINFNSIGEAIAQASKMLGNNVTDANMATGTGGKKLAGFAGNTGIGTGAHIDIRVKNASGQYIDPSKYFDEFLVGGKKLTDWIVTSARGMRVHPVTGQRRMHQGVDFGGAGIEGQPIHHVGEGQILRVRPEHSTGGGGVVTEIKKMNGDIIQLLHLQHRTFKEVAVGQKTVSPQATTNLASNIPTLDNTQNQQQVDRLAQLEAQKAIRKEELEASRLKTTQIQNERLLFQETKRVKQALEGVAQNYNNILKSVEDYEAAARGVLLTEDLRQDLIKDLKKEYDDQIKPIQELKQQIKEITTLDDKNARNSSIDALRERIQGMPELTEKAKLQLAELLQLLNAGEIGLDGIAEQLDNLESRVKNARAVREEFELEQFDLEKAREFDRPMQDVQMDIDRERAFANPFMSESQRALVEIEFDAQQAEIELQRTLEDLVGKLNPDQIKQYGDKLRELNEIKFDKLRQEASDTFQMLEAAASSFEGALAGLFANLGKSLFEQGEFEEQRQEANIEYAEKIMEIQEKYAENPEQMQKALQSLKELNDIRMDGLESEAKRTTGIMGLLKNTVLEFTQSIVQAFAKLAAQKAIMGIFGGLFGGGGGLGGLFGGLFKDGGEIGKDGLYRQIPTISQAMAKEGAGARLIVAHDREQILTDRNGDAQLFRALQKSGDWARMKQVSTSDTYAMGGSVGQMVAQPVTNNKTYHNGGNRYNMPVYNIEVKNGNELNLSLAQIRANEQRLNNQRLEKDN